MYHFCEITILVLDEEPCKMEVLKWKMISNNIRAEGRAGIF